ncbi:polyketide cyclase / dehydrase and lipid transport [Lapillicoccus sp.]|uniref:polyketide cyclase / dehydrase and lipid transport n=1 Tax=Lapillicoccus sp. TaxID=1909287 RepID=UPI0039837E71
MSGSPRRSGLRRIPSSPRIDLSDETFIRAAPDRVAGALADPRNHQMWWPHLELILDRDRGTQGQRWVVTGALRGAMEVWVESFADGAIVHHYVRAVAAPDAPRDVAVRHTRRWKLAVHRLKDRLEEQSL